jgi:hypothetical protein
MYKNDIISEVFLGKTSTVGKVFNESYKKMDCASREMQKPCANEMGDMKNKIEPTIRSNQGFFLSFFNS